MVIGLSYRSNPHDCRLNLHPAETKALPHEGASAHGKPTALSAVTSSLQLVYVVALQFSSQLHVARYPYIALLSGSGGGARKVASSEGLASAGDLMQLLQPAVDEHGAQFVADQADHNERVSASCLTLVSQPPTLQTASELESVVVAQEA